MKTQLRKYDEAFRKYRQDMIETIVAGLLFAGVFASGVFLRGMAADRDVALWKSLALTPEPEICALCGNGKGMPCHAPVLVDLSTGETGELRVYDPDPLRRYEPAEEQPTGSFSLLCVAGLTGYRDTGEHICHVILPEKGEPIDPSHFCRSCRAVLAGTATKGHILADLYDPSGIAAYPITDGAEYTIRGYAVSLSSRKGSGGLSIQISGLLSMDGG